MDIGSRTATIECTISNFRPASPIETFTTHMNFTALQMTYEGAPDTDWHLTGFFSSMPQMV